MIGRSRSPSLPREFWIFWVGQAVSQLGSSVTRFVLPLLVYQLTRSALSLGIATATVYLPYLLFGLVLGAWLDRTNRRSVMIATDMLRALLLASIPVAFFTHVLSVWWLYAVSFVSSTLSIAFTAGSFAAVPALVTEPSRLVTANSRLQISFSAASLLGPLAAGLALIVLPPAALILADSASFLASAASLAMIRRSFNATREKKTTGITEDVKEGLLYVLRHPVLRTLALLAALINVFFINSLAQLILLARVRLDADNAQIGWLYASASLGVIVLSILAPILRRRFSFGQVLLGSTLANGLLTLVLGQVRSIWLALPLWGGIVGTTALFGINTASLRQAITPERMLGRVITVALVLAWSVEPFAALGGGVIVQRVGDIGLVYSAIGVALTVIAILFATGPVGRADRFLALPGQATI